MNQHEANEIAARIAAEVQAKYAQFEPTANFLREVTGLCVCGRHKPRKTRGE